jgi:acetyl-CoA carboxylase biotin carboxyl carrier protein
MSEPLTTAGVEELAASMSRHGLTVLRLEQGGGQVFLKRGPAPTEPAPALLALTEICAPVGGVWRSRERPEAAPYAAVGARVRPAQVVGLIADAGSGTAEVTADCAGLVTEVVAADGAPVQPGDRLLLVDPAR